MEVFGSRRFGLGRFECTFLRAHYCLVLTTRVVLEVTLDKSAEKETDTDISIVS